MAGTYLLATVWMFTVVLGNDYEIINIKNSPGLYYEYMGETQLYYTEWKIVSYVNLKELDDNFRKVERLIGDHLTKDEGEIRRKFSISSLVITVNRHLIQLNRVIDETRRNYEVILRAIVNAQKGILEPHIITPAKIMEIMKSGGEDIPKDLSLPFPLSATYASVLLRLIILDVFISDNVLAYAIKIPLTEHTKFNVYKVIPFPVVMDLKCIYVQPEKPYLLMDITKQHYCKLDNYEFDKCKKVTNYWRVCKQEFVVQSTHFKEECEARMLQQVKSIPSDCSQRLVKLNETLWTQLDNNEWLFVAPKAESFTIICRERDAVDVTLEGSGKLIFKSSCKGYTAKIMIQSQIIANTNITNRDVIPPVDLIYDCCESESVRMKIQQLQMDSTIRKVISNVDDLNYASHKVEEVERLIEQEWKQTHSTRVFQFSAMTLVGLIINGV